MYNYNINWRVLVENWLLVAFQKPGIRVLANSFIRPIEFLHLDFMNFRAECLYKLSHNSQIVYLEAMLNDKFDPLNRQIKIANAVVNQPIWFRERQENREVFFYEPGDNKPVSFPEPVTLIGTGVDYSVCVPPPLRPPTAAKELELLTRMRGEIEYYNLYSKNYNIQWVQLNR